MGARSRKRSDHRLAIGSERPRRCGWSVLVQGHVQGTVTEPVGPQAGKVLALRVSAAEDGGASAGHACGPYPFVDARFRFAVGRSSITSSRSPGVTSRARQSLSMFASVGPRPYSSLSLASFFSSGGRRSSVPGISSSGDSSLSRFSSKISR